jgi:hypothetical protein
LFHVGFGHAEHDEVAENVVEKYRHTDEEQGRHERVDKRSEFASD